MLATLKQHITQIIECASYNKSLKLQNEPLMCKQIQPISQCTAHNSIFPLNSVLQHKS